MHKFYLINFSNAQSDQKKMTTQQNLNEVVFNLLKHILKNLYEEKLINQKN